MFPPTSLLWDCGRWEGKDRQTDRDTRKVQGKRYLLKAIGVVGGVGVNSVLRCHGGHRLRRNRPLLHLLGIVVFLLLPTASLFFGAKSKS